MFRVGSLLSFTDPLLSLIFYCDSPTPTRSLQERIILATRDRLLQGGSRDWGYLLGIQVRVLLCRVFFLKRRLIKRGAGFSVGDLEVTVLQGFTWFDALSELVVDEF